MQEKPFYVHIELHKEIVKNAWIISYEERKMKEKDSKLLLGLREAERNCNTIHKSMGRQQGNDKKGSGCTDKTVCRHRNQHFRSSGKFIRSKYEKCGKYNKNIDSTPQKKR